MIKKTFVKLLLVSLIIAPLNKSYSQPSKDLIKKVVSSGTNARSSNDYLGYSVSIDGDIAVAGAYNQDYDSSGANFASNAGAAYVYYRNSGGTDNWGLVKKLVGTGTNGRNASDYFGLSVAVSGNIIVVGAYGQDYDSSGANYLSLAGAAYVFYKDQGGTDNWGLAKKISASGTNARVSSDLFGWSVAISDETIAVGTYGQDYNASGASLANSAGAVYLYQKNYGGTDNWGQVKKITPTGTNARLAGDQFGYSLSLSGDLLLVGARLQGYDETGSNNQSSAGAAYIFSRNSGGTDNWGQIKKLVASGTNARVSGDYFGTAVSISGDYAVVDSERHQYDATGSNPISSAGAVFVFNKDQGGTDNWGQVKKIVPTGTNERNSNDRFGNSVAVLGNVLVIGSRYHGYDESGSSFLSNAGAAYLYHKDQGGTNNWGLTRKIVGTGTNGRVDGDGFGSSVGLSDGNLLIGAFGQDYDSLGSNSVSSGGAAYVIPACALTYTGSSWSPAAPNSSSDSCFCTIQSSGVTLPSGGKAAYLQIDSSVSASISASQTFSVIRDLINEGSLTGDGTLQLSGTETQTIYGTGLSSNLTLDNSSGASIQDSLLITGVLTLTSGTLSTNDKLALKATSTTSYGQVSGTGSGSISGNMRVEKKISNTSTGWRQIGLPVDGILDDFSGINIVDASHTPTNEINIYYWESAYASGSIAGGWTAANSGAGYKLGLMVYGNKTTGTHAISTNWSSSGSYSTGNIGFNIRPSDDPNPGTPPSLLTGWNLIPNPYPSNLDVSSLWSASGFPSHKAIYIWDALSGQYVGICSTGVTMNNYNNTQTTNSASVIAPFQTFWVKTSTTSSLTLTNSMRTTSTTGLGVFLKKAPATIRVNVSDSINGWDQLVLYEMSQANLNYNEQSDALKLYSLIPNKPAISCKLPGGEYTSIKALDFDSDSLNVKLHLRNNFSGKLYLFLDLDEMPSGWIFYLKDKYQNTYTELKNWDTVSIVVNGKEDNRYELVAKESQNPLEIRHGKKETVQVLSDGDNIYLRDLKNTQECQFAILNMKGQQVQSGKIFLVDGNATIKTSYLIPGMYIFSIPDFNINQRIIKR